MIGDMLLLVNILDWMFAGFRQSRNQNVAKKGQLSQFSIGGLYQVSWLKSLDNLN